MTTRTLSVEVKDPLKQGLKHYFFRTRGKPLVFVEVKDPLKQGLKPEGYKTNNYWQDS